MKYFYYQAEADMSLDQFLDVLDKDGTHHLIGDTVQGAVLFAIKRSKKDFTDSCFQLEKGFYEFDAKGAVTEITDRPDWAKTPEQLSQMRLVSQYGLEELSFMDGIKKLSELPTDDLSSILKGLLPNLQLSNTIRTSAKSSANAVDQKPKVKNLSEDQFAHFYKLMSDAVKNHTLPTMHYFGENGVTTADQKRGFRTYYRALVGDNIKPRDTKQPDDQYFEELQTKLKAISDSGVNRAYHAISSELKKYEGTLPISELQYSFKG